MASSKYHIKDATIRKIKRRKWIPIRYRLKDQAVHGWIIEKAHDRWLVWLVGDEDTRIHPRVVAKSEWKFIVELT